MPNLNSGCATELPLHETLLLVFIHTVDIPNMVNIEDWNKLMHESTSNRKLILDAKIAYNFRFYVYWK